MKIKIPLLLVAVAAGVIYYHNRPHDPQLTNLQIIEKYECERMVKDIRNTDIYCNDHELYRQHALQRKVVAHRKDAR